MQSTLINSTCHDASSFFELKNPSINIKVFKREENIPRNFTWVYRTGMCHAFMRGLHLVLNTQKNYINNAHLNVAVCSYVCSAILLLLFFFWQTATIDFYYLIIQFDQFSFIDTCFCKTRIKCHFLLVVKQYR